MPIAVAKYRLDLSSIVSSASTEGTALSIPLRFGLGAGLYFEYFRRPSESPSQFIVGFNRQLDRNLTARIVQYQNGAARQAIVDALRENALLFNLDQAPTNGLLGIELLAEQLAEFAAIPDWQTCLNAMRECITSTNACYRRLYVRFLQEIKSVFETRILASELTEIADEWDALAAQLEVTIDDPTQLERTSRLVRRLAFREEHFWGNVLERTNRIYA